jgi:putative peptidoglycan lipid II flippase
MISNFKNLGISIGLSLPKFDDLTIKIIKSCGSITVLVLFNQLFLSSRMFFASYYGEGAISSLNYSSAITTFITALAFNSVFSVLLSNLSSLDFEKDREEIKKLYLGTIEVILFIFIPFASLFIIFDIEIIKIFYFRGNFDADGILKVSYPFFWDSLSILSWILYIIPTAFFLAIKKYRILSIYGSITYLTGVLLNYFFSDLLGYYGVAAASFLTTSLYGIFLLYQSKKILIDMSEFRSVMIKIFISGIIASCIVYFMKLKLLNQLFSGNNVILLLTGSLIYLSFYILSTSLLKVNYLKNIRQYLRF